MALPTPNLFNGQTTDGNSTAFDCRATPKNRTNLIYTLYAYGTFNGATVKFQASYDGTTYIDITNASYTSAKVDNLTINANFIRAVISGAGASTNLNVAIK